MNVVAIIQARMRSTRLPGKVLKDLGGRTVLAKVVSRVRQRDTRGRGLGCDNQEEPIDDRHCPGTVVHLKSMFSGAMNMMSSTATIMPLNWKQATAIVRDYGGLSDDRSLMSRTRRFARFINDQPDYASNTLERTYPRGLDIEVVTFGALERAWRESESRISACTSSISLPEPAVVPIALGQRRRRLQSISLDT